MNFLLIDKKAMLIKYFYDLTGNFFLSLHASTVLSYLKDTTGEFIEPVVLFYLLKQCHLRSVGNSESCIVGETD